MLILLATLLLIFVGIWIYAKGYRLYWKWRLRDTAKSRRKTRPVGETPPSSGSQSNSTPKEWHVFRRRI